MHLESGNRPPDQPDRGNEMNKRERILRRVNRQFAPGLPEWVRDAAAMMLFGVLAYCMIVMMFCMGKGN